MQSKTKTTDFTRGKVIPQILLFSLPILLGQLFQNLYNSVDSIVVGRFVGLTALAAVSTSAEVSYMLVGFFTGLSVGAGVLFSRYFGAKDYDNLHDAIHTALAFSLILGVLVSLVGIVFTPQILRIMSCPEDVFREALVYLRIYSVGVLFTAIYNVASGVLRAVGNSRDPFRYLVISSVTNIVLDLVFVIVFHLGILGVALATVLSQLLSMVMALGNMIRTSDVYQLRPRELKVRKDLLLQILDLGLPAAVQSSLISISNLFVQRFINMLGPAAIAGMGAAKKVDKFAGMIGNSVGLAATTFISQNVGARQMERAFKGIRASFYICMVTITVVAVPTYVYARTVLSLFTEDPEALVYGVSMIHILVPMFSVAMVNQIMTQAVRGFGKSRMVMVLSLLGMVGMRQLFLQIGMGIHPSPEVVYWAYPLGWGCSGLFCTLYYLFAIRLKYNRGKKLAAE